MKEIGIPSLIIAIFLNTIAIVNAEPTVCSSPKVFFTKENFADWNQPENQDRITDNVWITRQDLQGIFNIKLSDAFSKSISPANTEWTFGSATNHQNLTFNSWQNWHNSNPPSTVGRDAVLHLIDEDVYLDIKFLSWTQNRQGGGFSYERSTCSSIELRIEANNSNEPITIQQASDLSLTISLDPGDSIRENVDWWLVATSTSDLLHYDLSSNSWQPGLIVTFQGPLFNLSAFDLTNMSGLSEENYTFYFGFDNVMNGSLDIPNLLFERTAVNIAP